MKRLHVIIVALMSIVVVVGIAINFQRSQQSRQSLTSQSAHSKTATIRCSQRVLPENADPETEVQVYFLVSSRDRFERVKIQRGDELIYSCTNFDRDMLTGATNSSFSLPILKTGEPFTISIASSDQVWARDIVPNNPKDWGRYDGELPEAFIVFVSVNDKGRLVVRQDHEWPIYE